MGGSLLGILDRVVLASCPDSKLVVGGGNEDEEGGGGGERREAEQKQR